jgi:hypothetical protein
MMLAAVLGVSASACDRTREVPVGADAELEQELALALQGDTVPAVFEDTAIAVEEVVVPPVQETTRPAPVQRKPEAKARPERPIAREIPDRATDADTAAAGATGAEKNVETAAAAPEKRVRTVPMGSMLELALEMDLSTETNQPGDMFTATLQKPVVGQNGTVIIPSGASVRGRVTHVQKSGRVGETAVLNLAFEGISWEDSRYPLEATVVQANPERVSRSSTAEQVGKVAAGAAAGALLGRVIGGKNKDAIKGAVVGAAAGTAIALGTADVDAVLKKGSVMVIRTVRPLDVVVSGL